MGRDEMLKTPWFQIPSFMPLVTLTFYSKDAWKSMSFLELWMEILSI